MLRVSRSHWMSVAWPFFFLCLTAGAAVADPISFDIGRAMWVLMVGAVVLMVVLLTGYGVGVLAIETWIVRRVLELDLWETFRVVFVINLVSVALGAVLSVVREGGGWKTAWMAADWGPVAVLWLQSLAIAIVVEFAILVAVLHGRSRTDRLLVASALANVGSYAVSLIFMLMLTWSGCLTPG